MPHAGRSDRWGSLQSYNFRLWVIGQVISGPGGWLQNVALAWLVLAKTESPEALGLVTVFQFLPELVGSPIGGVIVDRLPKRPLIIAMIIAQAFQAIALAVLVGTNTIQLWEIYALSLFMGITTTFSIPAGQVFVSRLVRRDQLHHAVALNAAVMNTSRVIGPALGGVVIATWGSTWCFAINAVTFVAPLLAQVLMRMDGLPPERHPAHGRVLAQLADGVRYATRTPSLMFSLSLVAFIGVFGINWQTTTPLLARFLLHTDAEGFGLFSAALGIGSLAGALGIATRLRPTIQRELMWAAAFSVLLLMSALMRWFVPALVVIAVEGVCVTVYGALNSAAVQLDSSEEYRGRVLALRSWLFMGSSPVGAALTGWLAATWSVQLAVGLEAVVCLLACGSAFLFLRRMMSPAGGDAALALAVQAKHP